MQTGTEEIVDDESSTSLPTLEDDSGYEIDDNEHVDDIYTSSKSRTLSDKSAKERENSGTVRSSLEVMSIKSTTERSRDKILIHEEKVRAPIRIHNRFAGRKSATESSECRDTEEWCKYEPNCSNRRGRRSTAFSFLGLICKLIHNQLNK